MEKKNGNYYIREGPELAVWQQMARTTSTIRGSCAPCRQDKGAGWTMRLCGEWFWHVGRCPGRFCGRGRMIQHSSWEIIK